MKKAAVLLSGGIDSAVTLYIAKQDHECHALIFDYGQKASKEIDCARKVAEKAGCGFTLLNIAFPWKGSALLDEEMEVPEGSASSKGAIPSTYVPGRNIVFLSYGISLCESMGAEALFIGAHQLDFSNYPDCRRSFFESFQEAVRQGTKTGGEGRPIRIETPILDKTKREIVELGSKLGVPFEDTWSCYSEGEHPCQVCESCLFRIKAFEEAGIKDPQA